MAANPSIQSTTDDRVRVILGRVSKVEPGWKGDADIFRDLGVKSAAALDLLLSLEEEFGVAIADDAFGEARTTDQIVVLIDKLTGGAAA